MEIKDAQKKVDYWIKSVGKQYFSELTNMCILSEEVGELARLIARKYGEQSFKEPIGQLQVDEAIKDELADVLWVTICLANQMNIDIEKAFIKNIEKKTIRDRERYQQNPKL